MFDRQFAEPFLAELYDHFCPWDPRGDFGFYLPLVIGARSVLDVGCGTGMLLKRARDEGHTGRLCGLDPAPGMLGVARRHGGIEWILGDLGSAELGAARFDLVVMTGHAFQVLVTDEELSAALATIRRLLAPDGRFAFETRNPLVRAWDTWIPANGEEIVVDGRRIRMEHRVDHAEDEIVAFNTTYTSDAWNGPEVNRSTLRFLSPETLARFLAEAGLEIETQFGNWDRSPLTESSPEIITIARAARS
jgi:SAM-dependent methyltransferase